MKTSAGSDSVFNELEGPAFRAPWEAQVFALICALQDDGCLPAAEWSNLLGEEIRQARERGDPDLGDTYYVHCLTALEKWLLQSKLAEREDISALITDWRSAYLNTPHGQPVELR